MADEETKNETPAAEAAEETPAAAAPVEETPAAEEAAPAAEAPAEEAAKSEEAKPEEAATEGTYPLPEAQLDRFMFLIEIDYPAAEEEKQIARATTGTAVPELSHLLDGPKVMAYQSLVRRVPVPEHVYDHAVALVRATRPGLPEAPAWIQELVAWGAGPRAVQYLILGAKARAALRGHYMAGIEDLEAVAPSVLAHRVITNFSAESQGMTSKKVVERLIEEMRGA